MINASTGEDATACRGVLPLASWDDFEGSFLQLIITSRKFASIKLNLLERNKPTFQQRRFPMRILAWQKLLFHPSQLVTEEPLGPLSMLQCNRNMSFFLEGYVLDAPYVRLQSLNESVVETPKMTICSIGTKDREAVQVEEMGDLGVAEGTR